MTNEPDFAERGAADARRTWRAAADSWAARLAQVGPADLQRPTPCAEWNVAALIEHTIDTHVRYGARLGYEMGDGREWEALKAQVEREGKGLVHLAGFRRDTKAILSATDLFLFPSLQEGLPCAVQEALCMEVPVVCYPIRGCVDLVDSSCGRIATAQTVEALTTALEEVLSLSPAERTELGRVGRQRMIERYSRPVCIAEWLAIYPKLGEST